MEKRNYVTQKRTVDNDDIIDSAVTMFGTKKTSDCDFEKKASAADEESDKD